jgi:hypothetical protein
VTAGTTEDMKMEDDAEEDDPVPQITRFVSYSTFFSLLLIKK